MFYAHILLLIILGAYLLNTIINCLVARSLKKAAPPEDPPLVSILIPARNEALNIEACVRSLLQQDYPNLELIVLDDHCEDDTAEKVLNIYRLEAPEHIRTVVRRGEPLPEGWTGKNWACDQLAHTASGRYFFFTDADTTHAPGTVSAAVAFAQKHGSSLLSAWPRMITETIGEKLIVPMIPLIGFAFYPHWILPIFQCWPRLAGIMGQRFLRALGGANGQFMFFTRAAYEAIGGHAAVRSHVVEDVALGREITARVPEGFRLHNADSMNFSTVRMYRSFGESWFGFTKNLRAAFDRQWLFFWLYIACLLVCWLAPCFSWIWLPEIPWEIHAGAVGLIYATRLLVTVRLRLSWLCALLHPVSMALLILISLHSWLLARFSKVEWKGRKYKPAI